MTARKAVKEKHDNNALAIWICAILLDLCAGATVYVGLTEHWPWWAIVLLAGLMEIGAWVARFGVAPAGFFRAPRWISRFRKNS